MAKKATKTRRKKATKKASKSSARTKLQRVNAKEKNQAAFLRALVLTHGRMAAAAQIAGVDRSQHYRWLEQDDYARRFDETMRDVADAVEAEITERAMDGTVEEVWYQGEKVGEKRTYDNNLLLRLAERHRPERWRRHQDVTSDGQALPDIRVHLNSQEQTDEQPGHAPEATAEAAGGGHG